MTISSQTICFEARCKCGVAFIHAQLASSYANAPQQLASSRSTVGFITRDFHALISRQHSQTNRHGLYTLFLTSKSRCMQKISSGDALLTTQNVLSRSGRFGGGHTGWSQLQLASSVSPLWILACQAIICTNVGLFLTGPLGTNFSQISTEISIFTVRKMRVQCPSFYLGLNVLTLLCRNGPWNQSARLPTQLLARHIDTNTPSVYSVGTCRFTCHHEWVILQISRS